MNNYCSNRNILFEKALSIVLQFEGGYVNHPNDPGGETNKGVTKRVYDNFRSSKNLPIQSVKNITESEVKEIYFNNYWLKASCDKLYAKIAILHFDSAVNCGVTQANRFLQRSVETIADGIIGPKTINQIRETKDKIGLNEIVKRYIIERKNYYNLISERNEKLKVFLKGWNNRVNILQESLSKLGVLS